MPALQASWLRLTGKELPADVKTAIERMIEDLPKEGGN
jgi:hypothetical protein